MRLSCRARGRRGAFAFDFAFESAHSAVALVGPSGCGKTSFLHGLAGLVRDGTARIETGDEVLIDDTVRRSPAHQRQVGYVFQDVRLFPHLTVRENIAFSHPYGGDRLTVEEALHLMDLEGFEDRRPAALSGGEARRVALARALAAKPRLLLLDEPFTGLDAQRRARLVPYLRRLRERADLPMILVSHDPEDVALITDATIRMSRP